MENADERKDIPINIDIGGSGLLDQLTKLAEASGNSDAQGRVAEIKRRLGSLSGGGGIGGIFDIVGKVAEMAQNLQGTGGEDGVQEFTVGGKKRCYLFWGQHRFGQRYDTGHWL